MNKLWNYTLVDYTIWMKYINSKNDLQYNEIILKNWVDEILYSDIKEHTVLCRVYGLEFQRHSKGY